MIWSTCITGPGRIRTAPVFAWPVATGPLEVAPCSAGVGAPACAVPAHAAATAINGPTTRWRQGSLRPLTFIPRPSFSRAAAGAGGRPRGRSSTRSQNWRQGQAVKYRARKACRHGSHLGPSSVKLPVEKLSVPCLQYRFRSADRPCRGWAVRPRILRAYRPWSPRSRSGRASLPSMSSLEPVARLGS